VGFGGALVATLSGARSPVLRPASVGATGLALFRPGARSLRLGLLALPLGFLAIAPALAGHASLQSPTGVLFPANVIHVLAMSAWSAGLVVLVVALPAATRELEAGERTRLLAATLARFSTVAGVAIAALLVTGVAQAWFEVHSVSKLWETSFGRAVLIKAGLLLGPLMALGAYNRQIALPRLRRIAAGSESPGRAGLLLKRTLMLEVALVVVVLGVTSALVSYPPPEALSATGPVARTASLGPADMQVTIDPARPGANVLHIYLTDKRAGTQYERVKEFKLSAALPGKQIGPLALDTRKAGPGHWVANGAVFGAAGDWQLQAEARVSDFDAYYSKVEVPIR
jgi:copper transport protein